MHAVHIEQIRCLTDNYCVILHAPETGETAAIDAPDAKAIQTALDARGWRLSDIFVTHHHADHTGGIMALKGHYACRITGPDAEAERIPGLDRAVTEGTPLQFAGHAIHVLATPGHTLGHLSYHIPSLNVAFTGNTLFALGCGRLFEGDAALMWASLQKIRALPSDTAIYCGHEYTLANGRFALSVEPENDALKSRMIAVEAKRAAGQPTLPTSISLERATNPFLRPHSSAIRARLGLGGAPDANVFARLRELKNKA